MPPMSCCWSCCKRRWRNRDVEGTRKQLKGKSCMKWWNQFVEKKGSRKVKLMYLLSGTILGTLKFPWLKDSNEVALLTGANSQCEITHLPHAMTINCCQSIKNKTLALAYTKLVPGSNWNALVCSLCKKKCWWSKLNSSVFFSSQFQAEVMWVSLYVLCAVVFCRQHLSVCLTKSISSVRLYSAT